MSIRNYNNGGSKMTHIQEIVQYLHDNAPAIEAEFDDLERRQQESPNNIFPIKMKALAEVFNASIPLYEWYIEKRKDYEG